MNAQDLAAKDPTFVPDLLRSIPSVEHVAAWLRSRGHVVRVPPTIPRPSVEERAAYADNGDLFIVRPSGELVVGVKQRMLDFNTAAEFPYAEPIVDKCYLWDFANPKPWRYVITNKAMTRAFVVKGMSNANWKRVEKYDKGRWCWFYTFKREDAEFFNIEVAP